MSAERIPPEQLWLSLGSHGGTFKDAAGSVSKFRAKMNQSSISSLQLGGWYGNPGHCLAYLPVKTTEGTLWVCVNRGARLSNDPYTENIRILGNRPLGSSGDTSKVKIDLDLSLSSCQLLDLYDLNSKGEVTKRGSNGLDYYVFKKILA